MNPVPTPAKSALDRAFWWLAPLILVVSGVAGYFYHLSSKPVPAPVAAIETTAPAPQAAAPPAEPSIKHPVPRSADLANPWDNTEAGLGSALQTFLNTPGLPALLLTDTLVRRIVITVDHLPLQKVPVDKRPLQVTLAPASVQRQGDSLRFTPQHFARYDALVNRLQQLDMKTLVALYTHYYPLFQESYEALGYPGGYFNDRLIEVIDSLLATPVTPQTVALTQPRVFYEYADPKLEALPAGQKLLLRMGNAHQQIIKRKLTELRASLAATPPAAR
jgi:hypothetical protein